MRVLQPRSSVRIWSHFSRSKDTCLDTPVVHDYSSKVFFEVAGLEPCQSYRFVRLLLRWLKSGWPDWANFRPMGDVLLWTVFKKYRSNPTLSATFFLSVDYVFWWFFCCQLCSLKVTTRWPETARCGLYFLQKNGLGYILGNFSTNSSGHPGSKVGL
jgi:hypothetical protein